VNINTYTKCIFNLKKESMHQIQTKHDSFKTVTIVLKMTVTIVLKMHAQEYLDEMQDANLFIYVNNQYVFTFSLTLKKSNTKTHKKHTKIPLSRLHILGNNNSVSLTLHSQFPTIHVLHQKSLLHIGFLIFILCHPLIS